MGIVILSRDSEWLNTYIKIRYTIRWYMYIFLYMYVCIIEKFDVDASIKLFYIATCIAVF